MCELLLTIREPPLKIVKIEYQLVEHHAQVVGKSDGEEKYGCVETAQGSSYTGFLPDQLQKINHDLAEAWDAFNSS